MPNNATLNVPLSDGVDTANIIHPVGVATMELDGAILLLHGNVFPFVDSGLNALSIANLAITLDTVNKKFGAGSMKGPGDPSQKLDIDLTSLNNQCLFNPDNMNLTIEAFVRTASSADMAVVFYGQDTNFHLFMGASGGKALFLVGDGSSWVQTLDSGVFINDNAFHFLAMVFSPDGKLACYVDTVRTNNPTISHTTPFNGLIRIGRSNIAQRWNGQMDEVRISPFVKYSGASLTVPTGEFNGKYITGSSPVGKWVVSSVGTIFDYPGLEIDEFNKASTSVLYDLFESNAGPVASGRTLAQLQARTPHTSTNTNGIKIVPTLNTTDDTETPRVGVNGLIPVEVPSGAGADDKLIGGTLGGF